MIPRLPKGFTHPMAIGEGSFSSVYRARQQVLDRWVAIKVLHEKDPGLRRKLLEEARTQASLSMPGIPAIYDAFARGSQVFLVMEWIKGVSLQALLARGVPRPADRAALAASLVAALAELHRRGFAHRDLKPANVLVSVSQTVHLVDFGFAKKIGDGAMSMAGVVKGTPAYMAPEIWRGDPDADLMRADLYSLGRVLSELDPGPPWKELADPLLALQPGTRPASAAALWETWRVPPPPAAGPGFKESLEKLAGEALSRLLLKAARQLLLARRREEAYWLLAECLQEDPDYAEALKLMEGFPQAAGGRFRNRKAWALAGAAGVAAALALGYFAGRVSERHDRVALPRPPEETRALLLPGRTARGGAEAGRFRELAEEASGDENSGGGNPGSGAGRLSGLVFLDPAPPCDNIRVDGKLRSARSLSQGLALRPGEHAIACAASARAERFTLLPFQRKVLKLKAGPG
jgi:predicted Ser/Thr protein kinase